MIVRATRRGLFGSGVVFQEVYHVNTALIDLQDIADGIAGVIDDAWEDMLDDQISTALTWQDWEVRRVDLPSQPSYIADFGGAGTGAGLSAATPMPPQITLPLNFYAVSTFPRNARKHIGGFTENNNTSMGYPTSATQAAVLAFGNALLDSLRWMPVMGSLVTVQYSLTPPRVTAYNALTSARCAILWGSLRSRRT